jgi:predicted Zn-dependent peptidase
MSGTRPSSILLGALALVLACRPEPTTRPVDDGGATGDDAPAALVWPDEPFRARAPQPGPIAELVLPTIETFRLDNGIEVYLVPQRALPTVTMSFQFDLGQIDDPRTKVGLAELCLDLLDEGTRSLDKIAFEGKQADHAMTVYASAGDETASVGLQALRRDLGPALDLLAEMLREPGLRTADFDRLVGQRKAWLAQQRATPSSIAARLYPALVYGATHPYGRMVTEASLSAVRATDCAPVVARLRPRGARLFVVGKITRAELEQELGARFAFWRGAAPKQAKMPKARPNRGRIVFVHVPEANQSQVWVGHPGPTRGAADYEPTEVMAQILGGGFASRINMNLREDKGFAYGGRGGFRYARQGSFFAATSSVRADATAAALRELVTEIRRMRDSDPTAEEVRREIDGRLLALPAQFGTASRTSDAFEELVAYGLPLDWFARYQKALAAVDIPSVRKAATTHLEPGDFTVLVVGDGAVILDDLRKLAEEKVFGSAGLSIVDADGRPAPAPPAATPAPGAAAPVADKAR